MADPSPEVVAAALALAKAADEYNRHPDAATDGGTGDRYNSALRAYRAAIAPKLRTRAERDAEFVQLAMRWFLNTECPHTVYERCQELAREQTAPEPDPVCEESVALRMAIEELKRTNEAQSERLRSIADWVLDAEGAANNIKRLAGET